MKPTFTLRTDKELLDQVREQAKQEQKTLSQFVEESLATLLRKEGYLTAASQPETKSDEA